MDAPVDDGTVVSRSPSPIVEIKPSTPPRKKHKTDDEGVPVNSIPKEIKRMKTNNACKKCIYCVNKKIVVSFATMILNAIMICSWTG